MLLESAADVQAALHIFPKVLPEYLDNYVSTLKETVRGVSRTVRGALAKSASQQHQFLVPHIILSAAKEFKLAGTERRRPVLTDIREDDPRIQGDRLFIEEAASLQLPYPPYEKWKDLGGVTEHHDCPKPPVRAQTSSAGDQQLQTLKDSKVGSSEEAIKVVTLDLQRLNIVYDPLSRERPRETSTCMTPVRGILKHSKGAAESPGSKTQDKANMTGRRDYWRRTLTPPCKRCAKVGQTCYISTCPDVTHKRRGRACDACHRSRHGCERDHLSRPDGVPREETEDAVNASLSLVQDDKDLYEPSESTDNAGREAPVTPVARRPTRTRRLPQRFRDDSEPSSPRTRKKACNKDHQSNLNERESAPKLPRHADSEWTSSGDSSVDQLRRRIEEIEEGIQVLKANWQEDMQTLKKELKRELCEELGRTY